MAADQQELLAFLRAFINAEPEGHFAALGLELLNVGAGRATMKMPWKPELVGDPETGVLHGGPISTLLDSCCGFAAAAALESLGACPTIDLRIDYMGPATPGEVVYADAEIYRRTEYVLFARAWAHHGDIDRPIATAVGNFFRMKDDHFSDLQAHFRAGKGIPSALRRKKRGDTNSEI